MSAFQNRLLFTTDEGGRYRRRGFSADDSRQLYLNNMEKRGYDNNVSVNMWDEEENRKRRYLHNLNRLNKYKGYENLNGYTKMISWKTFLKSNPYNRSTYGSYKNYLQTMKQQRTQPTQQRTQPTQQPIFQMPNIPLPKSFEDKINKRDTMSLVKQVGIVSRMPSQNLFRTENITRNIFNSLNTLDQREADILKKMAQSNADRKSNSDRKRIMAEIALFKHSSINTPTQIFPTLEMIMATPDLNVNEYSKLSTKEKKEYLQKKIPRLVDKLGVIEQWKKFVKRAENQLYPKNIASGFNRFNRFNMRYYTMS